ncbi:MAG: acyltransferase [Burkholderiales bacterium]|nr:acyltransferase [Burkholderiales bacterium]MBH2017039.1 acyltransferase [Burkholderiales bacterium]
MSTLSPTELPVSMPAPAQEAGLSAALASTRIGGLDFLRAVAVALVLIGHSVEGHPVLGPWVGSLSGLGVKVFFVLSGFLITKLILAEISSRGRLGFGGFYRRRLARLMPAFYLYLAVVIGILWWRDKPIPWEAIVASIFYVTNYYQAFTGAESNVVAHCWSLAVEEQFYLLWPLLLVFVLRRGGSLVVTLCAIIVAVWCWRWYLTLHVGASVDYLYRALDTRADELAVGCLVAVLAQSASHRTWMTRLTELPLAGPALVALLYAVALMDGHSAAFKYGVGYVIEPFIIAALMLITIAASTRGGRVAAWVNQRWLVHMGQVSYGMYLFHGVVMYTMQRAVEARGGPFWLGLVLAFLAVWLVAGLSFKWFETPLRQRINGH